MPTHKSILSNLIFLEVGCIPFFQDLNSDLWIHLIGWQPFQHQRLRKNQHIWIKSKVNILEMIVIGIEKTPTEVFTLHMWKFCFLSWVIARASCYGKHLLETIGVRKKKFDRCFLAILTSNKCLWRKVSRVSIPAWSISRV